MLEDLPLQRVYCPHCGEPIHITIDGVDEDDSYIEDCTVCCRPIRFTVMTSGNGETTLIAEREYDC